jgi:phospholipase/carboxylesterase
MGSTGPHFTRRELLALAACGITAGTACTRRVKEDLMAAGRGLNPQETAIEGRLTARPGKPSGSGPRGAHALGLGGRRDGEVYVPPGYRPERPAPLVVSFHGAGGNARHGLSLFRPLADEHGLIVLAPDSRGKSWDVIVQDGFGPDVAFLDRALAQTFSRYAVDPARLAIGGFSDGASYALSLGLANGGLFTHIIAFSPGFASPPGQEGSPRIYVSHGTEDRVLPIDSCSRRLVPRLKRAGYDVLYHEFEGPHTVPPQIARESLDWFLAQETIK